VVQIRPGALCRSRPCVSPQIKAALHFTIRESMSDTQIIHQLLSQLGIKLIKHWSRGVPGHNGEKLGTYNLDQEHWCQMTAVLARRAAKRERLQPQTAAVTPGSPAPLAGCQSTGDPNPKLDRRAGSKVLDGETDPAIRLPRLQRMSSNVLSATELHAPPSGVVP
jgi:hypothetical protein